MPLFFYKILRKCIYLERRVRDSNPKDFYIQTVFKTAPSTNRTHGMSVVYRTWTYAPNKRWPLISNQVQYQLCQYYMIKEPSRMKRLFHKSQYNYPSLGNSITHCWRTIFLSELLVCPSIKKYSLLLRVK